MQRGYVLIAFASGFGLATFIACQFGVLSIKSQPIGRQRRVAPEDTRDLHFDSPARIQVDREKSKRDTILGEPGYALKFASRHRGDIRCFMRGRETALSENDEKCEGSPPFWRWWHNYKNCYATAMCLRERTAILYGVDKNSAIHRIPKRPVCVNWLGPEQYTFGASQSPPPDNAIWHTSMGIHVSRIMPGHFGHDILNTLLYVFETLLAFDPDLLKSLANTDSTQRPMLFPLNEGNRTISSSVLDRFFVTQPSNTNQTHCFELAALSAAHTADAHLVFRRNSPTRKKRQFWFQFRDFLLNVIQVQEGHKAAHRNMLERCPTPRITLMVRSTVPKSSAALTANGRGRRILNSEKLVSALRKAYPHAKVLVADPGTMTLAEQQRLAMNTDILLSRMGSNVANAMFLPPDSLCIEIEAPDPAHLYYDHPSTYEELAEIFGHEFRRSTIDKEDDANAPVMGPDVASCCTTCLGPRRNRGLTHQATARRCCRRCAELKVKQDTQKKASGNIDGYERPSWFMNWWLANTDANIPEIIDLVSQYLDGRRNRFSCTGTKGRSSSKNPKALVTNYTKNRCIYHSSLWERQWFQRIKKLPQSLDDPDWNIGCAAMRGDTEKASRWLELATNHGNEDHDNILSYWSCGGVIEPLVGHLRHPYFHCIGTQRDTIELMFSTAYLILANASSYTNAFFFDAGASSAYNNCWWGCTAWFVNEYAERGLNFDRILLWEAQSPLNHTEYWRSVPAEVRPKMSYFNVPLAADPYNNEHHLWTTLKALADPKDFVVVKLDVDNHELEVKLVRQLLDSPELISLVDEFFWEHHVHDSPLRRTRVSFLDTKRIGWLNQVPSHDSPDSSLADSYSLFLQLRQVGIRAHSWI